MALTDPPDFTDGTPTAAKFQRLTDALRDRTPRFAVKTADETVNNSATLQNDDHLSWTMGANNQYLLEMHLFYNTGATPNIKFAWTFPVGLTMNIGVIGIDTGSLFVSNGNYDQTTIIPFGPSSGNDRMVSYFARIANSTTPGILQLQWAQNTANASNTIVRAGSHAKLTQIL